MKLRWADRVAATVVGVMLLAAAVLKVEAPAEALAAVAHTVRPVAQIGVVAAAVVAFMLIMSEATLGVVLMVEPSRVVRITAALVLVVFAAVLITRFAERNAPPCGCLGKLFQSNGPGHVWLDAIRNIVFAGALLLTFGRQVGVPSAQVAASPRPTRVGTRGGFTLVELLVVLALLSVLLAIILPSLKMAKEASKVARSLSAQQQLVATVHAYGQESKDYFPHFQPLDGTAGPVRMRGFTVMTGYFRAHMAYWLAAVGPHDMALINLAAWPPRSESPPLTDAEVSRGIHYSVFYLTATIAADPAAFTVPIANDQFLDPSLLRGVRWSEMTFPSGKGLYLDFAMIRGERNDHYVAGFGDGSCAEITGLEPPEPLVLQPAGGPLTTVMSTRNGIRGRDR